MTRTRFSRLLGAAAVAAALSSPLSASAQAPAGPAPAGPVPVSDDRMAEGRRQFDAGVALLEDPDGAKYEEAYRAFKRAYELTQSPKVLGNLAFAAFHLERDGEAIDAYGQYLREVPEIDEKERKQIQRDLGTLSATVARLKVTVKHAPGSFVLVDKREATRGGAVENEYAFEGTEITLRVRPGRHNLRVRIGDQESDPVDVTIDPGGSIGQELKFTPKAAGGVVVTTVTKPSLAGPIALGAVGIAGLAVGVVANVLGKDKQSELETNCPNKVCPASFDLSGTRTSAKTYRTVSEIGYIGGGALLAGSLVWAYLSQRGEASSPPKTAAKSSWLVDGGCAGQGCAMNLSGSF